MTFHRQTEKIIIHLGCQNRWVGGFNRRNNNTARELLLWENNAEGLVLVGMPRQEPGMSGLGRIWFDRQSYQTVNQLQQQKSTLIDYLDTENGILNTREFHFKMYYYLSNNADKRRLETRVEFNKRTPEQIYYLLVKWNLTVGHYQYCIASTYKRCDENASNCEPKTISQILLRHI
jgi:hypothetical protein